MKRSLNWLYLLDLKVEQPVCLATRHSEELWMWHARFGHLSFDALGRLEKMDRGLPHIKHGGELCDSYLARKQMRLLFPKAAKYRAKDALKLVHSDLCGPITLATYGGQRYFLLLMDDCSRYMWLQLLMSKDEAAAAIKKFETRAEAESGKKLRVLRTDRGGEFTFGGVCCVLHGSGCGATPHRTVLATIEWHAGATKPDGGRHGPIHDEGQRHASKVLGGGGDHGDVHPQPRSDQGPDSKTPFEAWYGHKPSMSFLRTFSYIGRVRKTKPNLTKMEDRSTPMVFLGYAVGTKAYRLYDPCGDKVLVSRDVVFDEEAAWD